MTSRIRLSSLPERNLNVTPPEHEAPPNPYVELLYKIPQFTFYSRSYTNPYQNFSYANDPRMLPPIEVTIQMPAEMIENELSPILNVTQAQRHQIEFQLDYLRELRERNLKSDNLLLNQLVFNSQYVNSEIDNSQAFVRNIMEVLNKYVDPEQMAMLLGMTLNKHFAVFRSAVVVLKIIVQQLFCKACAEHGFAENYARCVGLLMTDPRYLASHQIRDTLEQEQEHGYGNFIKVAFAVLFKDQLDSLALEPYFAQLNTNDEIWNASKDYFNKGCVLFLAQLFKHHVFTQSDIINYCHFILAKVFQQISFKYDAKLPKELLNQKDKKVARITHMEQQLTKLSHLLKSLPKNFSSTQQGFSLQLYILLYSNSNAHFQTELLKDELKFKFLLKFNDNLNLQNQKHILCWNHQLMINTLNNLSATEALLENQRKQILIVNSLNEQLSKQWTKGDISLNDIIVQQYQYEEQLSWQDKANLDQLSFLNTVYEIFQFAHEYGIMIIFYQQLLQVTQVLSLQTKMKLFNKLVNWIVDCYQDSLNAYQVELIYILTRLLFQRKVLLETILADSILSGNYLLPDHLFRSLINHSYNRDLQEMFGLSQDEKHQLNQFIYGYQYDKLDNNNIIIQYQIASKYSYFAETDNRLQLPNMFEFSALDTLKSLIFGPNFSVLEDELKIKKLKTLQTFIFKSYDYVSQNEAITLFFAEMNFSIGASIFYEVGISVADFQKKQYFQNIIALQRFVKTQNEQFLTLVQPLCTAFVFDYLWKACLYDRSGSTFVTLIMKLKNSLNQDRLVQLLKQTQLFNRNPDYFAVWELFGIIL